MAEAIADGELVTAPAWPAHAAWLAKFLGVLEQHLAKTAAQHEGSQSLEQAVSLTLTVLFRLLVAPNPGRRERPTRLLAVTIFSWKDEPERGQWGGSSRGRRGGGENAASVFQGRWAAVGNWRGALIAAAMAVFHGRPRPGISTALPGSRARRLGAAFSDAAQQLTLARCMSKAASVSDWSCANLVQLGECHAGPQQTLAARYFLEQLTAWPTEDRCGGALPFGDYHHRQSRRAMEVDVGVQILAMERDPRLRRVGADVPKPICFRITAPFLASTKPLVAGTMRP